MQKNVNTANPANPHNIEYGRCYTDWKIKDTTPSWREAYFETYLHELKATLKNYGLPMPAEPGIYSGCYHDLLFLDSHGIVVRTGIIDVLRLINPGIIQPLHWSKTSSGLTVALYPGLELLMHIVQDITEQKKALGNDIVVWGNDNLDLKVENLGSINNGLQGILIDVDNKPTYAFPSKINFLRNNALSLDLKKPPHLQALLSKISTNHFGNPFNDEQEKTITQDVRHAYLQAFNYHQPLRRAFARAFKDVDPRAPLNEQASDAKALAQAWAMAKNFHDHGYKILGKETNEQGQKIGRRIVQQERRLYSPWTKKL